MYIIYFLNVKLNYEQLSVCPIALWQRKLVNCFWVVIKTRPQDTGLPFLTHVMFGRKGS